MIGANGGMPWHLPDDLQWFKHQTQGKPIVMGRRTFESIGKALPRRRNFVLTRCADFAAPGIEAVNSLAAVADRVAGNDQIMVIGGAQIYALALPAAQRLVLTRIEAEYAGDTWFPAVDWAQWRCVHTESHPARGNTPAYRFMTYERIGG